MASDRISALKNRRTPSERVRDKLTAAQQQAERDRIAKERASLKGDKGEKGDKGDPGEPGPPGKDGEDGHSPQLGIDYIVIHGKNGRDGKDGVGIAGTGGIGGGDWITVTQEGVNIDISTGSTNTLYYGNYLTTCEGGGGFAIAETNVGTFYDGTLLISNDSTNNVTIGLNYDATDDWLILTASASYPQGSLYYFDGSGVTWGSSVNGISTTITASINAALSTHTHGSNISISATSNSTEKIMRFSSSSNGITVVVPSFLTTAAASTHTHSTPANDNIFFVNTNGHSFTSSANSVSTYWWVVV